ncbi:hypothetical protein E6O75_ATG04109 [Venturia nashicola]|uniref:Uncharacterized protein n=1 Tax=Venturia nashicola TaxID=86259 RepID=A0A4Z1PQG6_9PEZI|nr:hypothetical protein E6O75_ATG04109 [Venturia nashicola]
MYISILLSLSLATFSFAPTVLACHSSEPQNCCWGGKDNGYRGCYKQHQKDVRQNGHIPTPNVILDEANRLELKPCLGESYVADYCSNHGVTVDDCKSCHVMRTLRGSSLYNSTRRPIQPEHFFPTSQDTAMDSYTAHQPREGRSNRSESPSRLSHKRKRSRSPRKPKQIALPFRAQSLHKDDFHEYRPLFSLYLDAQKKLDIEDLSDRDARGRWKSFLKKWNQGELLEGWYDPATKKRADAVANAPRSPSPEAPKTRRRGSPDYAALTHAIIMEEESDDEFGPALPSQTIVGHLATGPRGSEKRIGPAIPNVQDLEFRDELLTEDQIAAREDLKTLRKQDRNTQKDRLEELVPRADPGSRERKLEKKKEVSTLVASARDAKEGGTEEVDEGDLMGDDGVEGFKKRKKEQERKKSERELRKEELWRVRAEERETRLRAYKEKEDKTMDMFKKLAAQRFGAG